MKREKESKAEIFCLLYSEYCSGLSFHHSILDLYFWLNDVRKLKDYSNIIICQEFKGTLVLFSNSHKHSLFIVHAKIFTESTKSFKSFFFHYKKELHFKKLVWFQQFVMFSAFKACILFLDNSQCGVIKLFYSMFRTSKLTQLSQNLQWKSSYMKCNNAQSDLTEGRGQT